METTKETTSQRLAKLQSRVLKMECRIEKLYSALADLSDMGDEGHFNVVVAKGVPVSVPSYAVEEAVRCEIDSTTATLAEIKASIDAASKTKTHHK